MREIGWGLALAGLAGALVASFINSTRGNAEEIGAAFQRRDHSRVGALFSLVCLLGAILGRSLLDG